MTTAQSTAVKRPRKWLGVLIKLTVSAALMGYLLYSLGHPGDQATGDGISPVEALQPLWTYWQYSLGAALLLMLSPLWTGLRWHLLVRAEGFEMHWWTALHLTSVGYLFDAVGVGATGGDAVKGYALYKRAPAGRRTDAVMTVLVDRLVGLISMAIMSMAGCTWLVLGGHTEFQPIGALMSVLTIVLMVGFAIPFARTFDFIPRFLHKLGKLGRFPARVYETLGHYRQHRLEMLLSFLFSLLNQAGLVAAAWLIYLAYAQAFATYPDAASWLQSGPPAGAMQGVELWALLPTGFLASVVGLFGGFGPGEVGLAAAFKVTYAGLHAFSVGTMLMLGFHAVQVVSRVVGLPFYLFKPVTGHTVEVDEAEAVEGAEGAEGAAETSGVKAATAAPPTQ